MLAATAVAAVAAVAGVYVSFHAQTGASASVTCAVAAIYVLVLAGRSVVGAARVRRQARPGEAMA